MASQVCTHCSHVNPADASYCYYDGVRLAGGAGGPINAGTQNFPTPFVFPSGLVCRNFDQFATTCQQNWPAAVGLLKDGMFAGFFGGMGRSDLTQAAKEASRFPDLDRGLDQFLAKLPSNSLQNPKLKVEPTEINLGQMSIGNDRTIELHLENAGMRLLYGSISSDCKWLTLGDAPGNQQKLFQFGADMSIPLNIRGKDLRASPKPLEGQLLIESNGGTVTVVVQVSVPIVPFKEGVLAGSKSPREIAEKARPKAAEAAQYFENGAIADWFKRNGWIYPVQGPSAVGLGAVQQFFEALGLAKAPKVEISVRSLSLSGAPGQSASANIDLSTQEKKMVYAHATCEQPWVDVSRVKLAGRTAQITVAVPCIPTRPGETLQTKIHIAGNGNQRFSVPLSVAVSGQAVAGGLPPSAPAAGGGNPFAFSDASSPGAPIVRPVSRNGQDSSEAPDISKPRKRNELLVHLIPLGVLLLGLFIFLIHDIFWGATRSTTKADNPEIPTEDPTPIDPRPRVFLFFDYGAEDSSIEDDLLRPTTFKNMSFGLCKREKDFVFKRDRLVFAPRGQSNNTKIKIDKEDYSFGKGMGEWVGTPTIASWEKDAKLLRWMQKEGLATWNINDIHITQRVRIIPGDAVEDKDSEEKDAFIRYYDACEVTYKIENKSAKAHNVGLRVLLDTCLGYNDGVPFTIPGQKTLLYKEQFIADVPDFVSVYEKEDLKEKGIVVQLNLRHSLDDRILDSPDELRLTKWPGISILKSEAIEKWDIPMADPRENPKNPDSAVAIYWNPKPLPAGEKGIRNLGYTYGLSSVAASGGGGKLAMNLGGGRRVGDEVSVVAVVSNAKPGEKVTLDPLPKGFTSVEGEIEQKVPPPMIGADGKPRPKPITWRLKATMEGSFVIRARTMIDEASRAQKLTIKRQAAGIFGN